MTAPSPLLKIESRHVTEGKSLSDSMWDPLCNVLERLKPNWECSWRVERDKGRQPATVFVNILHPGISGTPPVIVISSSESTIGIKSDSTRLPFLCHANPRSFISLADCRHGLVECQ